MPPSPKIAVVGSLNIDRVFETPRIPRPGETIASTGNATHFGGKGANQVIAAARAGSNVSLIGCIGNDNDGARYQDYLQSLGIETGGLIAPNDPAIPTGSAFIVVDPNGENMIVTQSGANQHLSPNNVTRQTDRLASADALILQFECPLPSVRQAAEIAQERDVSTILNPSPWNSDFLERPIPSNYLIVNESEAAALIGIAPFTKDRLTPQLLAAAQTEHLVITQGANPTLALDANGRIYEASPPSVDPIDTVGAGDAFAGAFATAVAEGRDLNYALRFGNAAGALATESLGAQTSLPNRERILALLSDN